MGICDILDGWDDAGGNSERFEGLRDFVNELLGSWGFDPPNWSDQTHPDQEGPGMYDKDTNTIHLDPDFISDADASDAVNVAIHEGIHAGIDQAGWDDLSAATEEWEAASLGIGVGTDLAEGCEDPTESGAPSDMPDYPWQSRER